MIPYVKIDWEDSVAVKSNDNPVIMVIFLFLKLLDFCEKNDKEVLEFWTTLKRPAPSKEIKPENMWSALGLNVVFKKND